ncbi:MAG: hypothetical protein UV73_C0018G0024 [Candidatus Gottesmanbacteria bacterium GW2011_GWA2_43_14]|uniref:Uncharacterized protein n=1 Tax=Candidatus Gottesmanbacteria bacterium GW2011_GWA2_43_14 TaxID=1618443 RepID=A0A0G1FJX3_9BACT|nr:MAG: hypothetical protein UV73_C0018G0024 [Candidatus Gottesmanbacteria bacterium GW2011_GWA2_43_14]
MTLKEIPGSGYPIIGPIHGQIESFIPLSDEPPAGGTNGDSDAGSDQHPGSITGDEAPTPGPQNPN